MRRPLAIAIASASVGLLAGPGADAAVAQCAGPCPPPAGPAPPPSATNISVNDVTVFIEGHSGSADTTFTVTRSGNSSGTVSVDYTTADGTAEANAYYDPPDGLPYYGPGDYQSIGVILTLSFGPGETTKTVSLPVHGDTLIEDDETFTLELSNASGATITDGSGTATINDDDPPRMEAGETWILPGDPGPGCELGRTGWAIQGDATNNLITGSEYTDLLRGGDGTDLLFGRGQADCLYGQNGADALNGEDGDDFIDGGNGEDQLQGSDGGDGFLGGAGDDELKGGGGIDSLTGGNALDELKGGDGPDYLYGGDDSDMLYGQKGDDRLYGEVENPAADTPGGRDKLYGGEGKDKLGGGPGNDKLYGGKGDDKLYGGTGDDLLTGGGHNECGAGDDTVIKGQGFGVYVASDCEHVN